MTNTETQNASLKYDGQWAVHSPNRITTLDEMKRFVVDNHMLHSENLATPHLVWPWPGVNCVVAGADERRLALIKQAWKLLPSDVRQTVTDRWAQEHYPLILEFCPGLVDKNGCLGVTSSRTARIRYDRDAIDAMPQHLALVLITHELAHEFLDHWRNDDESELAALWHNEL